MSKKDHCFVFILIDEYSRYTFTRLMKTKGEKIARLGELLLLLLTQFNQPVHEFQSDSESV
jgi:hypothetical protein